MLGETRMKWLNITYLIVLLETVWCIHLIQKNQKILYENARQTQILIELIKVRFPEYGKLVPL